MYGLNNICFVCLNEATDLSAVFHKETHNEIFTQVKYTLPELTSLHSENPVYICSSCYTTLRCFFMFKKKCLENYNRLNDYIKIFQEKNITPDQSLSELQRVINCDQLIKHDNDILVKIEENKERNQETEGTNNINMKEESLASQDSVDRDLYQQLLKIESVSDDEQYRDSCVTSEYNNALAKDETNLNTDIEFVKLESVSDDEHNRGSYVTSENNNALDKDETNSNIVIESQDFQCLICNEVFIDKLTFNTHWRNHIKYMTSLKCLICNKESTTKSHLYQHMKAHIGIKDYECSICKKKFIHNGNLKTHFKIHEGIKDQECPICKKKFIYNGNLKTHFKIHEGIKDQECSICKKKFLRSDDVKKHIKTVHDRIKDYECSTCKKKFSKSSNMKKHMKIHEVY